jgi:hypothetical protein
VHYEQKFGTTVFDYTGSRNEPQGILGKRLLCNFHRGETLVFSTLSEKIVMTDKSLGDVGPIQIKCPNVPSMLSITGEVKWDSLSLERNLDILTKPVS